MRVPRLAHQHAAAEVGADVAVFKMNIVDVSVLGKREQARVGEGLPEIAVVVQSNDIVALSVEGALERMVFSAKRERPIRIDDFLKLATFGV